MKIAELIRERVRKSSKRQNRADSFHLALVFECGGMRGVAAGGSAIALEQAGLKDCFDSIHGSSAGACAGAYFLAEQSVAGTEIFTEVISSTKYIHPWRLLSRPAMVDVEKIVNEAIKQRKRLDCRWILAESSILKIITTNARTGKPVALSNFHNSCSIYKALRSSLTIPGINEPGVLLDDGNRHIDGGISAPIPLFSAVLSGASHILIVGTRRKKDYVGSRRRNILSPEYFLLRLRYGKNVADSYIASYSPPIISGLRNAGVCVEQISRSDDSPYCGRFTIDPEVLSKVRDDAYKETLKFCRKINTGSEENTSIKFAIT